MFSPTKLHLILISGVLYYEYTAKYSALQSIILLNSFKFQGSFFSVRRVMFTNVSGVVPYSQYQVPMFVNVPSDSV